MNTRDTNLITADEHICHGKPIIKGTRIMVWQILELLEAGEDAQQIKTAFPSLPPGAIRATLHYTAQRAKGTSYIELRSDNDTSKSSQIFA